MPAPPGLGKLMKKGKAGNQPSSSCLFQPHLPHPSLFSSSCSSSYIPSFLSSFLPHSFPLFHYSRVLLCDPCLGNPLPECSHVICILPRSVDAWVIPQAAQQGQQSISQTLGSMAHFFWYTMGKRTSVNHSTSSILQRQQ